MLSNIKSISLMYAILYAVWASKTKFPANLLTCIATLSQFSECVHAESDYRRSWSNLEWTIVWCQNLKRGGEITTKILFNLSFSPKHAFKNILNPFYPEKINYYTYNNCVYGMRFSLNLTLITAVVDYWLWIQRTVPTNYCFILIRK